MTEEQIMNLDPEFEWNGVFKRNYCSLVNIAYQGINLDTDLILDGEPLNDLVKPLFSIYYRDWKNPNWFPLDSKYCWSSKDKALKWFNKELGNYGLIRLSKELAFEDARLYLSVSDGAAKIVSLK